MLSDGMAQGREVALRRNRSWILGPPPTLRPTSRRRSKSYGPHQVMGERVPQRYRLYLVKTAHHKPAKPASTRNGVDTLGGGGTLPIDVLRLATSHALAPLGNVHAAVLSPPYLGRARKIGFRVLVNLYDHKIPFIALGLVTTRRYIATRRPVVLNLLKAFLGAILSSQRLTPKRKFLSF